MNKQTDPRSRYIAVAARCFAEHGFHGASLSMLAREASVTKQALLHFFGSKERLYAEVLADLADRLCKRIDAIDAKTPEDKLTAYFEAHLTGALAKPDDARLVIRALLDSEAGARVWPLKPYLEALLDLAQQTKRWRTAPREEVLAAIYQLIGAIQYSAISTLTFVGMYGEAVERALAAHFADQTRATVSAFVGGR